jgi:hypothetical protein
MPKRDRRLKEEIKKCKETNRSLNDFFSTTGVLEKWRIITKRQNKRYIFLKMAYRL